jgi:competence protein CoiA
VRRCQDWHWAHKGRRTCDPWWENETEWHRAWKGRFPERWQEIVHKADNGERHIADVKTDRGWVIEFQHSRIEPEERLSRDTFYRKLVWVVDGARRKRASAQLLRAWDDGAQIVKNFPLRRVVSDDCMLLREWAGSNTPVFFDFPEQQALWWLFARSVNGPAYVAPYQRDAFVESHLGNETEKARQFDELVNGIPQLIADYESYLCAQASRRDPLQGSHQYMPRGRRTKRRL